MKLPDFGNAYSGERMRELIRQLELKLQQQDAQIRELGTSGSSAVGLSDVAASALGTASAGTSTDASRGDHVHPMPTAGDVGAEAAGTMAAHLAAADPHPQYLTSADIVPYSLSLIESGETVSIPVGHNLLLIDEGLDLLGSLDLQGSMFSVAPNV